MFSKRNNQDIFEEDDWEKESETWQNAAGVDALKCLCPISKEEYDYYENLCLEKKE